ncbi:hypothetical protein BIY23_01255 [Wolbachia pipientis]|uniref:Uncharacterized protein n=1 Tax=Wolbachia pipientis TaxID=955 RepID=A0A1E7QL09_WOLPI|nr:hypothetical protein [Wolbachia pipientis]OEY87097.1 hypothetical protein BIY23_01255 [Wolbachia pipientis]
MNSFLGWLGVAKKSDIDSAILSVVTKLQAQSAEHARQSQELQKKLETLGNGWNAVTEQVADLAEKAGGASDYVQQALDAQSQLNTVLTVVAGTIVVCVVAALIYQHIKANKQEKFHNQEESYQEKSYNEDKPSSQIKSEHTTQGIKQPELKEYGIVD